MKRLPLLVVLVFMLRITPAANPSEPLPWNVNVPIVKVEKSLYKASPRPGAAQWVHVDYVGLERERLEKHSLMATSDVLTECTARFSADNGKTWTDLPPTEPLSTIVRYQDVPVRESPFDNFFDSRSGVLLNLWLRQLEVGKRYHNATYWRISRDYGRTWSKPRQLRYEEGDEFDPENPMAPGFLKSNQAYPGSNVLAHSNGTLVLAVACANAPGDPQNDERPWRMGSLCFIGKWNPEANDYQWTPGKRVEISPDKSSRGLLEPEVAELRGGRVLVIWRGSHTSTTPGRKFFSVSSDGGRTLSPVSELKYDDGSSFYSPSSYHRMIRHSVTGTLYWIGNISAAPPIGNSPRYPLVIAEVDETIPALKKNTVSVIDDRRPEQPANIQFSNFSLLEDRESHALELYMALLGEKDPKDWRTADCYKYIVTLQ